MTNSSIRLTVAIATHGNDWEDRILKMNLPQVEGVDYVVSWQRGPQPTQALNSIPNLQAFRCDDPTLSANRNNALAHSKGDIVLISDDDLIYTPDNLRQVIHAFATRPDTDLLVMKFSSPYAWPMPTDEVALTKHLPKGFYVTAFMMAVSQRALQSSSPLRFNTNFGPGAPYFTASEDEIFLYTALHRRMHCRYIPFVCAEHPAETTGTRAIDNPGILRTNGAMIAIYNPFSWPIRLPLTALRISAKRRAGFFCALKWLTQGAIHLCANRNKLL